MHGGGTAGEHGSRGGLGIQGAITKSMLAWYGGLQRTSAPVFLDPERERGLSFGPIAEVQTHI